MRDLDGVKLNDVGRLVTLAGGAEVELDLGPTGRTVVRGTLACPTGALPHIVVVRLSPRRDAPLPWADNYRGGFAVDGRFEVPGIDAGTWSLQTSTKLDDGTHVSGWTTLQVAADGVVDVTLTLAPRP